MLATVYNDNCNISHLYGVLIFRHVDQSYSRLVNTDFCFCWQHAQKCVHVHVLARVHFGGFA